MTDCVVFAILKVVFNWYVDSLEIKTMSTDSQFDLAVDIHPVHKDNVKVLIKYNSFNLSMVKEFLRMAVIDEFSFSNLRAGHTTPYQCLTFLYH